MRRHLLIKGVAFMNFAMLFVMSLLKNFGNALFLMSQG
jgi:hypothetical protein